VTAPRARPPKPRLSSSTYPVRAPLLAWLTQEAAAAKNTYGRPRVLDVGCGIKPYEPLFAPFAASYVGVDVENPAADLIGTVEQIPVGDESHDVVLCTQVLEHALDPARAVAELWRVTAPGGRVLASTHGVQVFHPAPVDFWRWTHQGLERLFRESAEWSSVGVRPASGTASCMAMLTGIYLNIVARRLHVEFLGKPAIAAMNKTAAWLDGRSAELREPRPGGLYANFHVVAEKPAATR
jgi:SAM-dependent methyltransferase